MASFAKPPCVPASLVLTRQDVQAAYDVISDERMGRYVEDALRNLFGGPESGPASSAGGAAAQPGRGPVRRLRPDALLRGFLVRIFSAEWSAFVMCPLLQVVVVGGGGGDHNPQEVEVEVEVAMARRDGSPPYNLRVPLQKLLPRDEPSSSSPRTQQQDPHRRPVTGLSYRATTEDARFDAIFVDAVSRAYGAGFLIRTDPRVASVLRELLGALHDLRTALHHRDVLRARYGTQYDGLYGEQDDVKDDRVRRLIDELRLKVAQAGAAPHTAVEQQQQPHSAASSSQPAAGAARHAPLARAPGAATAPPSRAVPPISAAQRPNGGGGAGANGVGGGGVGLQARPVSAVPVQLPAVEPGRWTQLQGKYCLVYLELIDILTKYGVFNCPDGAAATAAWSSMPTERHDRASALDRKLKGA
ncbi:hypothetical protein PLESTB_001734900 [Pleodorina starrii]|uniref:Uncharacterized protein n=1 Tax=Pleodorina starrii TaxID=330485 RepID=A0A9W6C0N3_9CHLO|nr:hypothetical protein PLESTB_001734900 [Pleodorina starrii]